MVHASCYVMGTVASLLRRYANRRRGYEPIPRCEEDTEQYEVILFEEERQGPAALEARGDRLTARARRGRGTSLATWKDLWDAAFSYVLAGNWRKAALAFDEQAVYSLKSGNELGAASAFLRSAKCYTEIEYKDEGEVAATKLALEKALALSVKRNDLQLAATSCLELAEFYMEHQDLQNALDLYEQAADHYGRNNDQRYSRYCRSKANLLKFVVANEEKLRGNGVLPLRHYKRRSAGYMKPTDPDWRSKLWELFASTSVIHPPLGHFQCNMS